MRQRVSRDQERRGAATALLEGRLLVAACGRMVPQHGSELRKILEQLCTEVVTLLRMTLHPMEMTLGDHTIELLSVGDSGNRVSLVITSEVIRMQKVKVRLWLKPTEKHSTGLDL